MKCQLNWYPSCIMCMSVRTLWDLQTETVPVQPIHSSLCEATRVFHYLVRFDTLFRLLISSCASYNYLSFVWYFLHTDIKHPRSFQDMIPTFNLFICKVFRIPVRFGICIRLFVYSPSRYLRSPLVLEYASGFSFIYVIPVRFRIWFRRFSYSHSRYHLYRLRILSVTFPRHVCSHAQF